jgi:alanine racemase
LYGYLPSGEYGEKPKLRPVMKLYAPCVATRGKSYGGVGYADEERTVKQSSVVRIGYADGTGHSKGGYKALSGQTNDFCMDACIVEKKVNRGQWVCVMDDADEVASRRGTISYEVLCLAGMRAEKRYE